MKRAVSLLLLFLGALVYAGCDTMHNVAVSSFRVLDAPANYVRQHIDSDEPARTTTTTTTTTVSADSSGSGHPVNVERSSGTNSQRHIATSNRSSGSSRSDSTSSKPKSSSSPSPRKTAAQQQQQAQFPTAKAVPGKPGYVFSPFDPKGGYVDVSGYPSGAKVKDPYANKIFLVP